MRIASGKVVLGHDPEETFEVSPELKAILLESIGQCERGETISADELFREMLSRE